LPENVIQYFHSGSPTQIETLIRNPAIQLVCFTGSVAGGLAVQRAASDRVPLRVGLELGGKDPAYVRSDVDIKWAAEEIVDGAIFNSGQSCCSIERVYVQETIHDDFVDAIKDVLKGYKLGDPFDQATHIGPVVSKRAVDTIRSHIKDAVERGAKDDTPNNETFQSPPSDGNYVAPTLLTHVNHNMLVMKDETFGPVIPVMKVKDDAEAIQLMNDSVFGLTASIWTKDVDTGNALADEVEAGTVFVNRCDYPSPVSNSISSGSPDKQTAISSHSTTRRNLQKKPFLSISCCFFPHYNFKLLFFLGGFSDRHQDLAWVGWKDSGKGQTLSKFGFDQFVRLKSYHIKDYPK
jgi:acyl-CoA reductase-like NAD-dependent aldehyde dehydrogenase